MSWKLYEDDCFNVFPLLEDKSIDMILCDLPYGTTACKWDTPLPLDDLWLEYKRVIKDNGAIVLTASQPFTTRLISSNYEMFRYCLIWEKEQATNFMMLNNQFGKIHEDIIVYYGSQPVYNPQMVKTNYPVKSCGGNTVHTLGNFNAEGHDNIRYEKYPTSIIKINRDMNGLHPTQKPVALFEYLIKTYTNENDLVLDNCAGSGTTGVACENLNRNSILMEQEPDYCQTIKDRMATAHELKLEQRKQTSLQAFKGQQTLISPAK